MIGDDLLRCPRTHQPLRREGDAYVTADGAVRYPLAHGVPLLVDEAGSLFSLDALRAAAAPSPDAGLRSRLRARLAGNAVSEANFARLAALLEARREATGRDQRVLVVGGGILGFGMAPLVDRPGVVLTETDVYLGPRTRIVCDAHDLPFVDGAFDAVVVQAVLEHVLDPPRVVAEIHRVLVPAGLVYAETPFMQQVHEGAYDFTRYTASGHRRLFRCFDELGRGVVGGPGEALAWSVRYFAIALAGGSRRLQQLAGLAARVLTLPLTWLDRRLLDRPAALDAASGTWFLGTRRDAPVPDAEIIASHRGLNGLRRR
jgi:SAM-dependent methyltransferase